MFDNTERFDFPPLPDEAVIALNEFLEDFYIAFQNHYFTQLRQWDQQPPPDDDPRQLPLDLPF